LQQGFIGICKGSHLKWHRPPLVDEQSIPHARSCCETQLYALEKVKRCPQSWGYLCAWTIFTCNFKWGDNGNPLSVSVQEILYRGVQLFGDAPLNAIFRSVNTVAHFW